jgi:hypothetical protein
LPDPARPLYSLDASALVNPWGKLYQPDLIPSIWHHLDELIRAGAVLISMEVFFEVERQADDLHRWCKERKEYFVDLTEEVQDQVTDLLARYPRMVAVGSDRGRADPFVIALAKVHNPPLTVVTEEGKGKPTNPKIPYVCREEGLEYRNFNGFLRETGWRERS